MLTFDDGAMNNYEHAYPVLSQLGCTATFFVSTDYIGGWSDWRGDKRKFRIMGIDELKALREGGFEIGSHARQHVDLTSLSEDDLDSQLRESRERLATILADDVPSLAYPYGLFNLKVVEATERAGYKCACSVIRGANQDADHPFALKRIMVTEATSSIRLRYFLSGLLDFEHERAFRSAVTSGVMTSTHAT